MSARVHHSSTRPWTAKNKVHNTRQSQQQIEKNSARQLVEAIKAQKAAALQEQAAVNIPHTSNGNSKNNPSLDNALEVRLPLLEKPRSRDSLHPVELPRALETAADEDDDDDDSDSGPTTQRSRHAPRRIVLDETWASDRPCKRRMSASRRNARLWQNILSTPPSLPSGSVSTSATASASVSASALPLYSPSPLPSPTLPISCLQQTSTSSKATGTTMRSRVPSARRGQPFRCPSEWRPAGHLPSFDLLDKPPAGWKHPLGSYGHIQGSSCNGEGVEVIHDSDDRVERSRRVGGDDELQMAIEASATQTAILESKPNQAKDQPSTDGFVANVEKKSRRRRPQTPDSSDSEDQLTASLLKPWRKSGSLGRSWASTSSSMYPDTAAEQSRQQETSPRVLHGYTAEPLVGDTLAKAFQLNIHSEDEPMQSAAEDNGETYLEGDMEMDGRSPSKQREQTATPAKAVDAAPRPQTEDELEKARQRVEALCRSYNIIPEGPLDSPRSEEGEIIEAVMDRHSARDSDDSEIATMDMDDDSSQSTPGTEEGEIAGTTLNKDNVGTEDNCNILVLADTTHISPFERIKALAQKIPPSPSIIHRQIFHCSPVYPMQHQWPYPPPAYYPGPIQIPQQRYHVPYGPYAPYYDYRQVPFNGYTEQQQYADNHSPSSWACVPCRREPYASDHQLPAGSERDLHSPTPGRGVAVQSSGQPFERQSSSESTPRLSSASLSVSSPEQCPPALSVPSPPPGPRPSLWTTPLPSGSRPPLLTPPPPQDPRPSLFVPPLSQSPPPTSAAACPGLQSSLSPYPLQHDPVSPPDKSLVTAAPRPSVSPLTTPEPLSRDATAEQSADETVAAPLPPAKFRKLTMREKFMLDQNKIKRIADLSRQMVEKQERLIRSHNVHFPETPLEKSSRNELRGYRHVM